jgi:hypothetical protein
VAPRRSVLLLLVAVTAAVALGAPAQAASTIDQVSSGTVTATINSSSGNQSGQSFTAGRSGLLTQIDIGRVARTGSIGSLTVRVFAASAGLPVGGVLASATLAESEVPTPLTGTIAVRFSSPATVTAGQQYAFVLVPQSSSVQIEMIEPGTYAGGFTVDNGPASWGPVLNSDPDFVFTTYVDSGSTLQPAPVLQQFGKPTTGTCAEGASESLNWAGASSGGWGDSWAEWMNDGRGGAVCTRTLVYSNAQAKWIVG